MELNPYQSPQQDPTHQHAPQLTMSKRATAWLLSLLIVPAAAIAGSGTCTGCMLAADSLFPSLRGILFLGCIATGFVVAIGLLVMVDRWIGRTKDPNYAPWFGPILGLVLATPFALAAIYLVFLLFYSMANKRQGPPWLMEYLAFILPGLVAMLLWCAGFWIGLRFRTGRRKESVERL